MTGILDLPHSKVPGQEGTPTQITTARGMVLGRGLSNLLSSDEERTEMRDLGMLVQLQGTRVGEAEKIWGTGAGDEVGRARGLIMQCPVDSGAWEWDFNTKTTEV